MAQRPIQTCTQRAFTTAVPPINVNVEQLGVYNVLSMQIR
eukprot:CAMPEP_0116025446 /NCGR_PEP_ID=MMETSP0321-20121206/13054_1 /TAXON_ID=163516 /ORGANISM="Leptocylindrus danicus var. danicus, Strain B650" /LENGTH=39 /DNA_ID= /DNA_START= /DNA_END= /DNA_ORIENTATION=